MIPTPLPTNSASQPPDAGLARSSRSYLARPDDLPSALDFAAASWDADCDADAVELEIAGWGLGSGAVAAAGDGDAVRLQSAEVERAELPGSVGVEGIAELEGTAVWSTG